MKTIYIVGVNHFSPRAVLSTLPYWLSDLTTKLWQKGYAVYCPPVMTMSKDFNRLTHCDLVLILHDAETCDCIEEELKIAKTHNVPILLERNIKDLPEGDF